MMGSWDETCLVTQLAIRPGDPVRLILIVEQPYGVSGGGLHYPMDAWAPLTTPIRGEYADYGRVESCEFSVLHDHTLERLKSEWVDPPRDDFDATAGGYVDALDWDGVLNAVERGIAVTNRGALGQAMVHDDVYCTMVAGVRDTRQWWSKGATVGEDIRGKVTAGLEAFKGSGRMHVLHEAARSLGAGCIVGGIDYAEVLAFIAGRDGLDPLVTDVVDFACFNHAMLQMRKFYTPQSGKGSQHDEHDLHLAVNAVVADIIRKRRAEDEDDE